MSEQSTSRRKKDNAPRGVFRPTPKTWAIRFTCAVGHVHEETIGAGKSDAIRAHFARRARALAEPGWCPRIERERGRGRAREAEQRARRRMTFRQYAEDYKAWAAVNKRSGGKERYLVDRLMTELGDRQLEEITTADVERVRDGLLEGRTGATVNRYRDLLSAMFKRALRLGLVPANPVKGIPKFRETGQRIVYLTSEQEGAVRDALPERLRPAFTVAIHTGMRWGEQASLRWRHVDALSNTITIEMSKNGRRRAVPMNSTVTSALVGLASERVRPDDPDERLFPMSHRQTAILFGRAVEHARGLLREAGRVAAGLDGFTWHGLRHTFASRLVMAGVDLRAVQELGGWRTLAMVMRYAHLSPTHLHAAVERLVSGQGSGAELGLELDSENRKPPARAREVEVTM